MRLHPDRDAHPEGLLIFAALLATVLALTLLATFGHAQTTPGGSPAASTIAEGSSGLSCDAPDCALLAAGDAAPFPGYLYSDQAHAAVGQLGAAAAQLLEQLLRSDARAQAAEQDRDQADQAVERCADLVQAPPARPEPPAPGNPTLTRLVWATAAAGAVLAAQGLCDLAASANDSSCAPWARYTMGGAAAVSVLTVSLVW